MLYGLGSLLRPVYVVALIPSCCPYCISQLALHGQPFSLLTFLPSSLYRSPYMSWVHILCRQMCAHVQHPGVYTQQVCGNQQVDPSLGAHKPGCAYMCSCRRIYLCVPWECVCMLEPQQAYLSLCACLHALACVHVISPAPALNQSHQKSLGSTEGESESRPGKYCCVYLPDGTASLALARPGLTIRDMLAGICEKRGLSLPDIKVYLVGNEQVGT